MELRDYLQLAKRNWPALLVLPLLLAAGAFLNANRQPKMYESTATILLRPNDPNERLGTANVANATELVNSSRVVKSLAKIADGPAVSEAAAQVLGSKVQPADVRKAISVTTSDDSNVMLINATTRNAERSAAIANTVAAAYIDNRRQSAVQGLERAIAKLDENIAALEERISEIGSQPEGASRDALLQSAQTQFKSLSERRQQFEIDSQLKRGEAEIVGAATPGLEPVSPKPLRSGIVGFGLGAVLAVAIALLRDRLDVRLRSRDEAEEVTELVTLAEIPLDRRMSRDPRHIAAIEHPDGVTAEAVRSLRVSLRFLSLEQPMRVLLVTSAMPSDGKSTVSTNLAASYAVSGVRTLLISADLRRPKVEGFIEAEGASGLVEILSGMAEDEERRQQRHRRPSDARARARSADTESFPVPPTRRRRTNTEVEAIDEVPVDQPRRVPEIATFCFSDSSNLWVLPAGQPVANPVEILGSPVAKDFFAAARDQFDMIIVDSPPVLPVSDSLVMAGLADGVVLVASVRQTSYKHLARANERLRSAQANVVGMVLNRIPKDSGNNYYGKNGMGY